MNCGQEGKHEIVRWGFTLRVGGEGQTEATQTWEVLPAYVEAFLQESEVTGDVVERLDGMKGMAGSRNARDAGQAQSGGRTQRLN